MVAETGCDAREGLGRALDPVVSLGYGYCNWKKDTMFVKKLIVVSMHR
jgi:hypothetical protein